MKNGAEEFPSQGPIYQFCISITSTMNVCMCSVFIGRKIDLLVIKSIAEITKFPPVTVICAGKRIAGDKMKPTLQSVLSTFRILIKDKVFYQVF